ncbi:HAD family hydrolase [Janibacter melonis]|uniref:HAD-IA family hydrolase n=1 Tax=Janibacter melonis TaxID=262209 RepID=UPI001E4BEFF7|nr:HAD-IA family hydrolase [Janibacter melonis]MCB5991479.1 HAD-IA family hydrolase [Janibacter melonis]
MSSSPFADRTFAAVIFDNDGTLVDSSGSVERSWVRWAQEHDVDPRTLAGHHGMPAAAIIDSVAPHLDATTALARIDELELADVEGIVALPGVLVAIAALAEQGGRYAVATSAHRELAQVRLATAGIDAPEAFVTVDDVERGKPAPDPFLLAAQRLGVDPTDCLVCEDAPSGIAAARAAGCAVLAVTTTTEPGDLGDADLVVDSLADVSFEVVDGRVRVTPVAG